MLLLDGFKDLCHGCGPGFFMPLLVRLRQAQRVPNIGTPPTEILSAECLVLDTTTCCVPALFFIGQLTQVFLVCGTSVEQLNGCLLLFVSIC